MAPPAMDKILSAEDSCNPRDGTLFAPVLATLLGIVVAAAMMLLAPVDIDLCGVPRIDVINIADWSVAHKRIMAALSDVSQPFIIAGLDRAAEAPDSVPWLAAWREAFSWSFENLAGGVHANIPVPVRSVGSAVAAQFGYNSLQSAEDFLVGRTYPRVDARVLFGPFLDSVVAAKNANRHQLFSIGKGLEQPEISPLPELSPSFPLPDFLREHSGNRDVWHPILSIGAAGRAVAHHTHGRAWLVSVRGTKRWFLHPPNAAPHFANRAYAGSPTAWADKAVAHASGCARWRRLIGSWLASFGTLSRLLGLCDPAPPLICDAARGEALVLPPLWFHATTNVGGASIAVGHQQSMRFGGTAKIEPELATINATYPDSPHLLRLRSRVATASKRGVELLEQAALRNPVDFQMRTLLIFSLLQQYATSGAVGHYEAVIRELREARTMLRELHANGNGIFSGDEVAFILRSMAASIEAANHPRALQGQSPSASQRLRSFMRVDRERLLQSARTVEAGGLLE